MTVSIKTYVEAQKRKENNEKKSPYSVPGIKLTDMGILQACGLRDPEQLMCSSSRRIIAEDRQLYQYYLVKLFGYSLSEAARVFDKHHATVIHSVEKLGNLFEVDKAFRLRMRKIEVTIDNNYNHLMTYKQYFSIEKQLKLKGFDIDRSDLLFAFTKGQKVSLKALTSREYIEFIDWIKNRFKIKKCFANNDNSAANKMRRKLWVLFVRKMRYSDAQYKAWILSHGKFHKPINEHSKEELVGLVSQGELVYQSWLKELKK